MKTMCCVWWIDPCGCRVTSGNGVWKRGWKRGQGVLIGRQQLLALDTEQLDANAGGALEIGHAGLDIGREAHPHRVLACRLEHADLQRLGQIRIDDETPLCCAVQTQEHRARGGIATCGHAAALEVVDEELLEALDGVLIAAAGLGRQHGWQADGRRAAGGGRGCSGRGAACGGRG